MPHPETRLDAYWFWGALPSEADMRAQLSDFRAQGFGRIYIQARLSMPRDVYLSSAYLSAYATAIGIMAELGLTAGIYDDYAWTSGQAGGRTVEGADHLRERHLFWADSDGAEARISGITATLGASLGPAARHWIHEGGEAAFGEWCLVAAVLWHPDGRTEDITETVEVVETTDKGATFRAVRALPAGASWTVFASARAVNSRIVNYLLPEAGARFVERGLEPYVAALGPHFGRTVDCLFFDQPAPVLYDWPQRSGNLRNSLPWSGEFATSLAAHGPIATALAALLRDTGPETGQVRSVVYRTLTQMMQQAFFAPLRAFCDRNNLILTGHEILPHVGSFDLNGGFSAIDPRVAPAADFFGTDLWRDETAVDANNLDPQLAPLLGDSIARASGRNGCWTELYLTAERTAVRASGQWEVTPEALRAQLIRLHMLGASRVILHALYAEEGDAQPSTLDNMRFDFAPGYNLQPWWPVMGDIARETAELADFIEGAQPVAQVVLVYPYETALREGPRHGHATAFGSWCRALLAAGHRPLICDEAGLATASLGAEPTLHGTPIAAVALPGEVSFHDPRTAAQLDRLAAAGVPIWAEPPSALERLLAQTAPSIPQVEGLRALIAGRDAGGDWRIVLFNEGAEPLRAEILSELGLSCRKTGTPAARRLSVTIAPQEVRCLRLTPEASQAEQADLPPSRLAQPAEAICLSLDDGWTLCTGGTARPIRVDSGWQEQGAEGYSGIGIYERTFDLGRDADLTLDLPGVVCVAQVYLDGRVVGRRHHAPFRIPLGRVPAGLHRLRIEVANTMANAYYAETPFAGECWPDPAGLTQPPLLREAETTP